MTGSCSWHPPSPVDHWRSWRGDPGMPSWTDGHTVFIDAEAAHRTQLQCLVVQAALLCVGSLDPEFSTSWPGSRLQPVAT